IKQKWNIGVNASLAYNNVKYSVQESLNSKFYTQTYSIDLNYTTKKNTVFSSDFDYYLSTGRTDGFNQSLPLWNASIAQQIFKKKNAEIKFSVNDILNQNQSITRSVSENYIIDTRTVVLKRYFMLTFTYNLNRAGAPQQQQRTNMPPGMPGQMRRQMGN
ncbi:MAG TPA: outer membrane beta-barrel protein, partial [Chitinophagaceae bacterium]|nr:outer membrane beta-barrel protein [Chitinophagaceae bacterium]